MDEREGEVFFIQEERLSSRKSFLETANVVSTSDLK